TDRFGSLGTGTVVCLGLALVLWYGFMHQPSVLWVPYIFAGFMVSSSARRVTQNALTSMTPEGHERAAYTSAQFAFQHVSTGIAAVGSSWVLTADETGALQGMVLLSSITMIFVLAQPVMMWWLKRKLDRRPVV
ncbi:hypothetical protein ABMA58_16760, partial [Oceanospirillum sp. HFRX-1_2]